MIKIALVDDHVLVRDGLAEIIRYFSNYTVILAADNGKHFIHLLDPLNLPHLVILDIHMPEMNGFETAKWISNHYPQIPILVLSSSNDKKSIIKMIQFGVRGYLTKDCNKHELKRALESIFSKGIYFNHLLCTHLIQAIKNGVEEPADDYDIILNLPAREIEFLRLLCSNKTLKEIASLMHISPRTIDGYRDHLFTKTHSCNRIGLVIFAIKNRLVQL